MRMRVRVGGLYSLLLCIVLRVLFLSELTISEKYNRMLQYYIILLLF
jgi:hypothetical protein